MALAMVEQAEARLVLSIAVVREGQVVGMRVFDDETDVRFPMRTS